MVEASGDRQIDPSFGTSGKVTTDFPGAINTAYAVAIQRDNKIIVAGVTGEEATSDFTIARYNTDGSLDNTFGAGGKVTTDFGGSDAAFAVAIDAVNRIVVAGETGNSAGSNLALAHYNTDGSPDLNFGAGGKVITDFAVYDTAFGVALETNNTASSRIVVAGESGDDNGSNFLIARYTAAGILDSSFGSGGRVTTDFSKFDVAFALAIRADSRIVAAGEAGDGDVSDFALARYNSNGSLDTSFGAGGKVTTHFSDVDTIFGIAIQTDGKVVAAGSTLSNDLDFALARYNVNGSLDPGFGFEGKLTTDFSGSLNAAFAVTLEQGGKIVAAGAAGDDFALARYNADGTIDASYGINGKVTTDFSGGSDAAFAIAAQGANIVAVGGAGNLTTGFDFAIARYLATARPTEPALTPTLAGLSPNSALIGSPAFTLTVNGTNFNTGSVVRWNGSDRITSFVSTTRLTARIPASDLSAAGAASVTVFTPPPGGGASNALSFTVIIQGYEANVAPRPNGNNNGTVTIADWTQIGRFVSGLDAAGNGSEFQRADCAPRSTLGDGRITVSDWVQAGRYAAGLDPIAPAGGPTGPTSATVAAAGNELGVALPNIEAVEMRVMLTVKASGHSDRVNSLTIQLDALGDESALGFSLHYDPGQIRFVGTTLSRELSHAVSLINTRQAASGRIGVLLVLPAGERLAAGAQALMTVYFSAAAGHSIVNTQVSFGDEPVTREIAGVSAESLAAIYAGQPTAAQIRAPASQMFSAPPSSPARTRQSFRSRLLTGAHPDGRRFR